MGVLSAVKQRIKKLPPWMQTRTFAILLLAAIAVFFLLFGAKITLYVNFLMGNDIVVKLHSEKTFFEIEKGTANMLTFEASVTANPFCSAHCSAVFEDVSTNQTLNRSSFSLRPGFPLQQEYPMTVSAPGSGQALFRLSMECRSVSTTLCHTSGEPTRRSILIVARYNLTVQERIAKDELLPALEEFASRLAFLESQSGDLARTIYQLNKSISEPHHAAMHSGAAEELTEALRLLDNAEERWQSQQYILLATDISSLSQSVSRASATYAKLSDAITTNVSAVNALATQVNTYRFQVEKINNSLLPGSPSDLDAAAMALNRASEAMQLKSSLFIKQAYVRRELKDISEFLSRHEEELKIASLNASVRADVFYQALCSESGVCLVRPSVAERAIQQVFDLDAACLETESLEDVWLQVNTSMNSSHDEQEYPDTPEFAGNVSKLANNLVKAANARLRAKIPANTPNAAILAEILAGEPSIGANPYPEFNLTPVIVAQLQDLLPVCNYSLAALLNLTANPAQLIEETNSPPHPVRLFSEPLPHCPVLGNQEVCCELEACRNIPGHYPVLFLHGHSINQGVTAEYSLDAFNKLQAQLEHDGYLNAGVVSLYTERDIPQGILGMAEVPLTIKASYYFDIFEEPQNYVVVQTKSENIDTYAVRLKELIDTVEYLTGRPKVKIVATSMGGLVARRYLQIFGSADVDRLILIAVPNHGIAGNIADYCPVLGANLECEDMNAGSLFINKLNRGSLPNIPVYNIFGDGCVMSGGMGDGIVLSSSSMLDGAQNYIINGTCNRLDILHTNILNLDRHPEVYPIVLDALSADSRLKPK